MGMTMIDTAEMYENEDFIGKALENVRDKVFFVSQHPRTGPVMLGRKVLPI